MRLPQATASSSSASLAKNRERRKLPPPLQPSPTASGRGRDGARARKKHKRLDAIRDRFIEPPTGQDPVDEADGVGSLRRSTRQRRPVFFRDFSPSTEKKRRSGIKEANKNRECQGSVRKKNGKRKGGGRDVSEVSPYSKDAEGSGSLGLRLRSRARGGGPGTRENGSSARSKRKLFTDLDGLNMEDEGMDEEKVNDRSNGGMLLGLKVRKKDSVDADIGDQNMGLPNAVEESHHSCEVSSPQNDEATPPSGNEVGGGSNGIPVEGPTQKPDNGFDTSTELVPRKPDNDWRELPHREPVEREANQANRNACKHGEASGGIVESADLLEWNDRIDTLIDTLCNARTLDENGVKVDIANSTSNDSPLDQPRIREGRRCGLCGGGIDGKPPRRLVRDSAESDNDVYGGSSPSEEPNYDIWDGFGDEPGWLGPLLGPLNDRFGITGVWVHQHCAVWSPEVYFAGLGCLKNVRAALCRGRALKCSLCGRPGATIGCRVDRCPKTYHLPCSRADGCIFDHHKFLIACTDHRHLFQPEGTCYLRRLNKMKAKKMRLDMRKLSIDAWRRDCEAEEKWLENCGEDEEFLKREGKRLHRDITRIAPVYIGGSSSECETSYQGWESVAGLKHVIQCMKEAVILPLLYPEFFSALGITPPRGVLLHGYPGTGKTLVVRALIGECSRGDKRIAYFARKGADCLGKYVGDAERQLRLLFQVAEKSQPSIIFFDEIDGLAPRRSKQQDQTHSSVVSTLLALLDGLKSRGSVVVIGATNRPEAVDPALRRPGRFDREIYFPLPSAEDRSAILSLHTRRWPKPVSGSLLTWIAEQTPGFAGADLQALCTQAAMIALKRNCALQELLSAAEKLPNGKRHSLPSFVVDERDWLAALASIPPPCSRREAGIAANSVVSSPLHKHLISCLLQPLLLLLISLYLDERIHLPSPLFRAAKMANYVVISAMQKKKLGITNWSTHLHSLIQDPEVVKEIEKSLSLAGLLMGTLYLSDGDVSHNDDRDPKNLGCHKANPDVHVRHLLCDFSYSQEARSRFRLLIAGCPRSGQQHLAACILHGFLGHVEIQMVNLATMFQEGCGDPVQGITRILLKCLNMGRCVIYMPRIDLWAVDGAHSKAIERESGSCHEATDSKLSAEFYDSLKNACVSQSWNSFVEQADSVCSSASLMILATCEMPSVVIPLQISQFFASDVLNCKDSAPSERSVPRLLVQVDGNFCHEMVIDSSADKLLQDLVQHYVQLIHHEFQMGINDTLKTVKGFDTLEVTCEVLAENIENEAPDVTVDVSVDSERVPFSDSGCDESKIERVKVGENSCHQQTSCHLQDDVCLQSHSGSLSRLIPCKIAKGKHTLLLTIATFGYQILRFPHFAELCWATSKLKGGPCTDINGPWKVWPFNSCIIHADKSQDKIEKSEEKETVRCSPSSQKRRDYGSVTGLVAVGLLAHRGVYTSIREVSAEVRSVLELLMGEINKKIQFGKSRWKFLRLLSQAAYFEDMVSCWAYGLRSLEMNNQMPASNSRSVTLGRHDAYGHNAVANGTCVRSVHNKSNKEVSFIVPEQSSVRVWRGNSRSVDFIKEGFHFDSTHSFASNAGLEGSSKGEISSDACPVGSFQISAVASGLTASKCDAAAVSGSGPSGCASENYVPPSNLPDEIQSLKQSNVIMDTTLDSEDGVPVLLNSIAEKGSYHHNCMPRRDSTVPFIDGNRDRNQPVDSNSDKSDKSSITSGTCFYSCCVECIHRVRVLIQEILINRLKSNRSCLSLDDVHDAIIACSATVLAAIRKCVVAERCNDSNSLFSLKKKHETRTECCACRGISNAFVKNNNSLLAAPANMEIRPKACICHLKSNGITAAMNSYGGPSGPGLQFFFRDSVLVPSDPDNVSFYHCKFENICLCSIVDWVLMIKASMEASMD